MLRTALVAATSLLALVGCGAASNSQAGGGVVQVVAGENVWGDVAKQIGGDHVKVTSIISDPNTDPHEYESNPSDALALARAKVVIENGLGYDDFLAKQVAAAGGGKTVITVAAVVGASGDDANPHLWYSPAYVTQAAQAIEAQLERSDPADAATFRANLQTFLSAYAPYAQTIERIKATYAGTAIAYTERVPGYLVDGAGLLLGVPASFTRAVEDGTDPSPADTTAFDTAITTKAVKVLLYNAQVVDDQTTKIKQLATSSGVPIVGVTETVPPSYPTFQAWQIAQAQALLAALGG